LGAEAGIQRGRKIIFYIFLLLFSSPLAAQQSIPLIISDHHADQLEFFLRNGGNAPSVMVVLDTHTDTVLNENYNTIRSLAAMGNYSLAGELAGNHNWIHPLCPPLETLAWISVIQGASRSNKLEGFYGTIASWNKRVKAVSLTLNELSFWDINISESFGKTLFISVDLDFFFGEDHGPQDVPSVLDALFSFSSRWQGRVVWGICLSRPWLPDDQYAWTLLEQSLNWLISRPEFAAPVVAIFNSRRIDTSRTAQAYRERGREIPALRERDAPESVLRLLRELQ
jgi:hypothetical protein